MLHLLAAHGTCRARRYRIQHRRNSAHIILAQQQPEQPGKGLRIPAHGAQHRPKLFHGRKQNLPELVVFLRRAVVPPLLCPESQSFQTIRQTDLLQKAVQRIHLIGKRVTFPEAPAQIRQRGDAPDSGFVQSCQLLFGCLVPFTAQTIRVEGPLTVPFLTPDAPEYRIVLQFVALLRGNRRQHGFQVTKHRLLIQSLHGRIQCCQHRGHSSFLQNVLGTGQIHRHTAPAEHQRQNAPVAVGIGQHHADVPVAAARQHQFPDPFRGDLALIKDRVAPNQFQPVGQRRFRGNQALKEPVPNRFQSVPALRNVDNLHGHTGLLGNVQNVSGGLTRLLKGRTAGFHPVTVQTHRHHRRLANHMGQNCHVLAGQIGESIYVKPMLPGKIAHFQLFQQPVHLIPRIVLALSADAVVSLQDQRQLVELLGQGSTGLLRSDFQILRGDAAAFEFVHRIQKPRQKFRSCLHGCIGFQLACQHSGGGCHGDEPSAVVQTFGNGQLFPLRHPAQ